MIIIGPYIDAHACSHAWVQTYMQCFELVSVASNSRCIVCELFFLPCLCHSVYIPMYTPTNPHHLALCVYLRVLQTCKQYQLSLCLCALGKPPARNRPAPGRAERAPPLESVEPIEP